MKEKESKLSQANDKEIWVGENKIYLDENNVLHYINVGEINDEIGLQSCEAMAKVAAMGNEPVDYLIDLNKGGKVSYNARRMLKSYTENNVKGKLALWGLHPVARILASFFMGVTRKKDMRFFKSKDEAFEWFKKTA